MSQEAAKLGLAFGLRLGKVCLGTPKVIAQRADVLVVVILATNELVDAHMQSLQQSSALDDAGGNRFVRKEDADHRLKGVQLRYNLLRFLANGLVKFLAQSRALLLGHLELFERFQSTQDT